MAGPSTADVLEIFTAEIAARGGRVTDSYDDGRRLFARSVLDFADDVRPGDRLHGGVALRMSDAQVAVHPYLFRVVCRNGAVMPQALGTESVEGLDVREPAESLELVREAVAVCCAEEVFTGVVRRVRSTADQHVDFALQLLPMLARFPAGERAGITAEVVERFFRDGDRSHFGLVNAVTSLARDTRDPARRWELEELGGALAVARLPTERPGPRQATSNRLLVPAAG